jgi:hypothetical protein
MKLCIKRLVQVLYGGTNVVGSRYVMVARVAFPGEVPAAISAKKEQKNKR